MQLRRKALTRGLLAAAMFASLMPAHAENYVTRAQDLGSLTAPVTLSYTHSFNDTNASLAGLQLVELPGSSVLPTDFFYDDYAFQIDGSSFNSLTATIDLGTWFDISNLQVRLYQGTLLTTTTGAAGPGLVAAWSAQTLTAQSSGGNVQVIAPIDLAPGSYVLEVRGNLTGTSGGSYAGVLNLAPVPEPGALGMMFAGLGMLGFMMRRRQG